MKDEKIASVYAKALYSIAKESELTEKMLEILREFDEVYRENIDFKELILNPFIDENKKISIIKKIFLEHEDILYDSLFYIVKNKRISMIKEILDSYLKIYYYENNMLEVSGTFTRELLKSERKLLIKKLEKITNKSIELEVLVDKTIIGGGILKIKDKVIDGSLRKDINSFMH